MVFTDDLIFVTASLIVTMCRFRLNIGKDILRKFKDFIMEEEFMEKQMIGYDFCFLF